jgi:hypothetical protein
MNSQTLFLAWQDQAKTRRWFPIGRLDVEPPQPIYRFRYTRGAKRAEHDAGFEPLPDFPQLNREYKAAELFPLFQNRVMGPARPDFAEYIKQLGLEAGQQDPVEILSVSGGRRTTDTLEVFPKLVRQSDGSFHCRFFLHGSSHVNSASQERLEKLTSGEGLNIALELTNPATGLAVQVQTKDYFMIGWAPRYLVADLAHAIASSLGRFKARVVRVNPLPAPSRQRLLVEFHGHWPAGHEPMSADEFLPLVA